ncbi:MAG TPA: cob(I)yrinic acid a,c-diamide adenosyltransferase [Usitatibacter sp.]|nr:cob(I)yrinic acid a,c-diamide adenosyltransferase [Usitatibacter sp.]
MGKRLTKIYTRTGDDGTTGLGDGTRVAKDSLRIEAIGAVDSLNSFIGRVLSHDVPDTVRECLVDIQHDLFELGAELCLPGVTKIEDAHLARLERELDAFNADLPGLKEFILPGGSPAAADAHLARTACRNAERVVVALGRTEPAGDGARRYLNRLSDLMFVIARVVNRAAGRPDVLWQQGRNRG